MVNHLLSLITPRRPPAAASPSPSSPPPDGQKQAQLSSIRGSLITIGKLLNPSFNGSLLTPARNIDQTPTTIRHQLHDITQSVGVPSPVRPRKNQSHSTVNQSSAQTPRRGDKAKQRRVEKTTVVASAHDTAVDKWNSYCDTSFGFHGRPTTELLGWRRLFPEEIVRIKEGAFVLISIPPKGRRDDPLVSAARGAFFDRVINAVILSKHRDFPNNGKSKKDKAKDYLAKHHSIPCQDGCTQIACVVKSYPHRDEYMQMSCNKEDVQLHLKRGAGLNITLLDFQTPPQRQPDSSILLKWTEITAIEMYVEYRRGDARPRIELSNRKQVHLYADELATLIELVKNDDRLTLELAYAFMSQKSRIMTQQLTKALIPSPSMPTESTTDMFITAIGYEVERSKLQNFARRVDLLYQDAWYRHYTSFQDLDRFQVPELADEIYEQIQDLFPLHFNVIHSLMFGARSHQPSQIKRGFAYSDRKRKLVNYFFSMIRVRDPACLVHWAMVGTLAMMTSGGKFQHFRNPVTSTFSAGKDATLSYLDDLFESTRKTRLRVLRQEAYLGTSFDNYNNQHPVTNHDGKGNLEHTGIVFNAVRARAVLVIIGTVVINNHTEVAWTVTSSKMIDPWTCGVVVQRYNLDAILVEKIITLPSVHWRYDSVPGDPMNFDITYTDQYVPRSTRQLVPTNIDSRELLLGNRSWMKDEESEIELRSFDPREHVEIVKAARRIHQLVMFKRWCAGDEVVSSNTHGSVITACSAIDRFLSANPEALKNIKTYQQDSVKYWNVAHYAVDQVMLFEICPRNEMKNDEATIALQHMMEELGMLYETESGNLRLSKLANRRLVFQYGDVLSIKKWYDLQFYILRKMTHIGREDYVAMIMSSYKRFIKIHDYLHENIHRVQAIYKLFYGGFIQAIQALLGSRRIKMDPTKGSWKEHKLIIRKMYYALERLRVELFLKQGGAENCDGDLWILQERYQSFCLELEKSKCSISRMCAIFMKVIQNWLVCEESISVGDWAVLEVYGCDWIEFWASTGKHQYLLESKRRMEAIYGLSWMDLEYHRMGRLPRLNEERKTMTMDNLCETHVHFEKRMAKNSNFPTVIKRSRHIHAGERCRREMYGMQYKRKKEPSLANDVNKIYVLFKHVGVFQSPNVSSELGDNTFWKRVLVETSKSKAPVEWHRCKQDVLVSPKEAKVLEVIWDKNVLRPSVENVVKNDDYISASDDNSSISANGSIKSVLSVGTVDDLVEEQVRDMSDMMGMLNSVDANLEATSNNLSDETVFTAARAIANDEDPEVDEETAKDDILKKLSNVTKYKMNMDCLSDPFSVGRTKLKNVKSDRDEELALFERKVRLLWWSVDYFRTKREKEHSELQEKLQTTGTSRRDYKEWEVAMKEVQNEFDLNNYFTDDSS